MSYIIKNYYYNKNFFPWTSKYYYFTSFMFLLYRINNIFTNYGHNESTIGSTSYKHLKEKHDFTVRLNRLLVNIYKEKKKYNFLSKKKKRKKKITWSKAFDFKLRGFHTSIKRRLSFLFKLFFISLKIKSNDFILSNDFLIVFNGCKNKKKRRKKSKKKKK